MRRLSQRRRKTVRARQRARAETDAVALALTAVLPPETVPADVVRRLVHRLHHICITTREPATALENPLRSAAAQRNERMATARLELATVCPRLRGHQPLHESLLEPLEASSCSKPSRKSYCAWRRCLKLLRRCRRSLVLLSMALLWRCASRMPPRAPPVALRLLATLATLT